MAKILLFDIETSPNQSYTWDGKYELNAVAFVKEWELLSFAHKWLDEKTVHVASQRLYSEKQLVGKMWKLLDEADIVVAHNGDAFDVKKMAVKFIQFGFPPPSPFQTVDTKKAAKRRFKFNSNALDDLSKTLNLGQKEQTGGFKLWLDCMNGVKSAWLKMEKYNKGDVTLLERVYKKLLPWINNHPNVNSFDRPVACTKCGGDRLQSRGVRISKTSSYRTFQCQSCGGWLKARVAEKLPKPEVVNG